MLGIPRLGLACRLGLAAAVFAAATVAPKPVRAQGPGPAYVVFGDSVEFGLGDDVAADGFGYVPIVASFLSGVLGAVTVHNFGEPSARTHDIRHAQLRPGLAALAGHAPVVVSWGGGGNDLAVVALGAQAAVCRQTPSCLGRFNALLNNTEEAIDQTIGRIRQAVGPAGTILMRTQYNALARTGCGTPDLVALGNATLEGAPGTVLDRGLNDRIRSVAERYAAKVVDVFPAFFLGADMLVSPDCIHPSGLGYQAIGAMSIAAYLNP